MEDDNLGFLQKTKALLSSLVSFLLQRRKTVLLMLIVIVVTLFISSLVSIWLSHFDNLHIPSIGTIRTSGVKAYWDVDITNETKEISWGQLRLGSDANVTLYLRSASNMPITLEMTTGNWVFSNSLNEIVYGPANSTEYMTLLWDYDGSTINPGQLIQATLTLRVEATTEFVEYLIEQDLQQFSFDINIRALE